MNGAWSSLMRKEGKRELVDPLGGCRYLVRFAKEKSDLIISGGEEEMEERIEEEAKMKQVLEEVYERFRTRLSSYLEHVRKEGGVWRFFDVAYGVQISVKWADGAWEIWMDQDLGFRTRDEEEAAAYVRGLIFEFDSWLEKELMKFHDAMVAMMKK
ncbi:MULTISPECIES: hypothetical protein [Thermoactinomyces]|jgi:hypothetical protein|uniref:Uncharacterized protein n=1 Tax=Thermoactinomyces daqus TaxID=1329516 RepID=A0A7W1X7U7_9BACL|nr:MULTISPECIES: hypothetical protein [Thermoactinomyces]MBA4541594.1 hypothetical protein [Thermoactinomyces daqus]MBH8597590.1 hypothetical protein [Thermoactinomyces sp. CICC 10523]MBH8603931.1 hypothetical protein [Thermoactinomyces sp. CICC 10522]MBH8606536.1 hypothetical protein [Thermoactinomyces sp. CICC 10521]